MALGLLCVLLSLSVCLARGGVLAGDACQVGALSGRNCTLKCTAEPKAGVRYRTVVWYKLGGGQPDRQSGLLRKDLPHGETRRYAGLDREMELLDDSHGLSLTNVTCADGGLYLCRLWAPVGEQNRQGQVRLTLTDCPVEPTKTPDAARDYLIGPTDLPVAPTEDVMTNDLVICATVLIMVALIILSVIHCCFNTTFKDRKQKLKKDILLDAPVKELQKKDLMLIYTLGPKPSTMKHICV
ncbi:CD83 antigen [Menidia menidia]